MPILLKVFGLKKCSALQVFTLFNGLTIFLKKILKFRLKIIIKNFKLSIDKSKALAQIALSEAQKKQKK